MHNESLANSRIGAVTTGSVVVGRAVRSTLVITAVALVVAAARSGDFRWSVTTRLAWAHRGEFALVFAGLVIWESWVARAKRRGVAQRVRPET
jgi:hypothetical protein